MAKKLTLKNAVYHISKNLAVALLLFSSMHVSGQAERINWRETGRNKSSNFYKVQKDFKQYWQGRKMERGKGFKVFKRWENFAAPRVYPSGNTALLSTTYPNFISWQQKSQNSVVSGSNNALAAPVNTGDWTALGPFIKPSGYDAGAGRVDFLRFDPQNSNIMYVGTPDGGLWKSTNGGGSWATNTDFLPIIGCADLAIHPTNTQIMYLATGNWEFDRRSIGILKSTDGGATWNTTGLVWTALDNYRIRRLVMHPTNPSIMMAATDGGVFRTTDGWVTYTQTIPSVPDLYDIEFKPGAPNTVYAAGTDFWRSTNNGVSWTKITMGLPPAASVSRIMLGVSAANANYVYAVMGDVNRGFLGLYRSTNSGTSFSIRSSTPNILNGEKDGSGTGGQATHDLAIAVSPTNANLVTVGGISQWRSTNGGTNWSLLTYWYGVDPNFPGEGIGPEPYIHADIQSIEYLPGSSTTMFATCDGGIFKSVNNGANWTDISGNLSIAQQTSIALSASSPDIMIAGLQDIGTLKAEAGGWFVTNGGDGEDGFIDRTNDLNIVTSNPNGNYALSTDGGVTRTNITGLPSGLEFFSPISQDPVTATTVYAGGRAALYRSTNFTSTWTMLGTPAGTGGIIRFVVAPSNNSIIYALKYDAISKSTNAGVSWTNITGTLPVASASLTNLTITDTDAGDVWVTFSGYSEGNKVFETKNGGNSWTNVSAGLPNLPFNTIVHDNDGKRDALYLGGDLGVYYMDRKSDAWAPYFTGLPNVAVTDLEIFYQGSRLRASTYGRGTWESHLHSTDDFNITANAGPNGTISPEGNVNVISGRNQTFTITPNPGYVIEDVVIDGNTSLGPVSSYTFTNVTEKHKIRASFTCPPITLAAAITNLTTRGVPTGAINLTVTNGFGPFTYSWTGKGDFTSSSEDITGLDEGKYRITVTQANGCDVNESYTVTEPDKPNGNQATGDNITSKVKAKSASGSITLSVKAAPNPSENNFTIRMSSSNTKPIQIRVLDIYGRVLFADRGSVNNTYRFGEKFAAGTYVVEITQGTERKTVKVVKR